LTHVLVGEPDATSPGHALKPAADQGESGLQSPARRIT
jgi:hypothetical protein